jgi:acyl carrier protein
MMTVQRRLREFIVEELQWEGSPADLTDDLQLIEQNVLDSLGLFQVVSFIETTFGVEIRDEDLLPEHFGTLDSIARLVNSKTGEGPLS